MGLKFRRGTNAQKSGSLAFGEPYVNTDLGTLQIGGLTGDITLGASGTGSQGSFAGISGSSLDITGNAKIDGNLTLGGNITIGDNTSDTVNMTAALSSSLLPSVTNAFDLGSTSKVWRDLYISTGSIKVVNNGSVLSTLSTNADGSQTFPNGLYSQANIQIGDGSYLNAGKFEVGRRGTSPDQNVVLGIDIMPSLTSGVGNVGLGRASLYRLTTGQSNIAVGDQAGYGISGSNSQNIAIGYGTAFTMTGSNVSQNVFLGTNAGTYLNDGIYNTAIGGNALLGSVNSNDTPTKSTALGYSAGAYLTGNSTNNLLLGANAGPSSDTTESYKLYVSNGDYQSQPFMNGNMANDSRTLNINASTTISGSATANSFNGIINATNGVVSGSAQTIANLPAGTISGSSQVTPLLPIGVISGSSQLSGTTITDLTITNLTVVNETASVIFTSGSNRFGDFGNDTHEFTGSVQISGSFILTGSSTATSYNGIINATNGVVSGSSQINATATTNWSTGIKTRLDAETVVSGSKTISGITLGSNLATLTIGTGLSGTSYNGSTGVTIANTGVTSITAGTGVSRDSATGTVTISIGQAVATSDNVRFASIGVGMAASGTSGRIDAANDIVAFSTSDVRLKENIKPIENALDKISKISGNTYDWKADLKDVHGYEGNDVGVIAQEVEAVLPQLVQDRDNGYKAVKYDKLVALLIEGIKEQQTQIHNLTLEIENLKKNNSL
jgi:hypothetical protein